MRNASTQVKSFIQESIKTLSYKETEHVWVALGSSGMIPFVIRFLSTQFNDLRKTINQRHEPGWAKGERLSFKIIDKETNKVVI